MKEHKLNSQNSQFQQAHLKQSNEQRKKINFRGSSATNRNAQPTFEQVSGGPFGNPAETSESLG